MGTTMTMSCQFREVEAYKGNNPTINDDCVKPKKYFQNISTFNGGVKRPINLLPPIWCQLVSALVS